MRIVTFLKRHQLTAYFTLALMISWGAILLVLGSNGLPAGPNQVQTMGMALLLGPTAAMLLMTGFGWRCSSAM